MTIDTLITEMLQQTKIDGSDVPKKSKDWIEKKDKCLVEILKKMNDAKK